MNYLIIEGYQSAALSFSQETGLPQTQPDFASIEDRMCIRRCIQQGKIEEAIERVNDLDPEVSTLSSLSLGMLFVLIACL